jgi:hypothetical protein
VTTPRCLFILKNSNDYHNYDNKKSSGLRNSARFVSDMLNASGIPSKVSIVTDNNDIDREVSNFKPTHVFIEALWVVSEKFDILVKLHPSVKWVIRIHSELPFLAQDGVAVQWLRAYVTHKNVFVAANSLRGQRDIEIISGIPVVYLPNFYPINFLKPHNFRFPESGFLNIGCFGAVRPMKNQLIQATAALKFAHQNCLLLRFHINATRPELQGEAVLKNLRALFKNSPDQLVEHSWLEHAAFLKLIRTMDLAMSVSLTETFSIMTADAVSQAVAIVSSPEISWTSRRIQANPTDSNDIVVKLGEAFRNHKKDVQSNQEGLLDYSEDSQEIWLAFLGFRKKRGWFGK